MSKKSYLLTDRLYDALRLAFELHGRDARKSSAVPVLAHLLSVCAMVQFDAGSEDDAIAALLHDALEDKPEQISREQIRERFGERVLQIVALSTDTPADYQGGQKPPWHDRKAGYLARIAAEDPSLMRVTVADKIDNLRAMLAEHNRLGEALWAKFNAGRGEQLWYYNEAVKAYRSAGFTGPLMEELERLVGMLNALPKGN